MTKGTISKLVATFGSRWGRVRPDGSDSELFFNHASLVEPDDFILMSEGQAVEFDETVDSVTGPKAIHVSIAV